MCLDMQPTFGPSLREGQPLLCNSLTIIQSFIRERGDPFSSEKGRLSAPQNLKRV